MTRFSGRNIGTVFGVQFLSFPIDKAKNYFGRISMTFPSQGPSGADKVENRVRMTRFWHPKYTHSI